jgi:simple sugar transport system substrate-binding protein
MKKIAKLGMVFGGFTIGGNFIVSCINRTEVQHTFSGLGQVYKPLLSFSQKDLGQYFFIILQESLNRAAQSRNWNFEVTIADMNPTKQSVQLEMILSHKPNTNAIICNPVQNNINLIRSIDKVNNQGIPIAIIANPITGLGFNTDITVCCDNYRAGEMAAQKIVSLLMQKYGEPKGTILNCYGSLDEFAFTLRTQGFESILRKFNKIQLLSHPIHGDLMKTLDVTTKMLFEYPNLDGVHVPSESPARGIYEAFRQTGKLHPIGSNEHIYFVTIDGEPIAHQWIKEGILDASISQDPIAYGEICVELLDKYAMSRNKVPLGEYYNPKYYWQKANIIKGENGPTLLIPPFEINNKNVDDKRLWGNIAFNDWGIKYF